MNDTLMKNIRRVERIIGLLGLKPLSATVRNFPLKRATVFLVADASDNCEAISMLRSRGWNPLETGREVIFSKGWLEIVFLLK